MNCQEGDFAIVTFGIHKGEILQCIKFVGKIRAIGEKNLWHVDQDCKFKSKKTGEIRKLPFFPDCWLKPLFNPKKFIIGSFDHLSIKEV